MKSRYIIWLVVIVAILGALFAYDETNKHQSLKIGVLVSLTGNFSTFGEDVKNGLELAKEHLQKEGYDIEFVYEDTASDPKKAVLAAQKLISVDKVPIIISGPGSSVNLAVAPLMQESQTVFIAISSTPKLNEAGEYIFKLQPDIDAEIITMVPFILEQGDKNIAIVYDSSSDTQVFGKDFLAEQFTKLGGEVVAVEGFDGKASNDYRSQLTKLKAAQPDAYYVLANDKGAGSVVRQAREQGVTERFYSWSAMVGEEFFKQAGVNVGEIIITDQMFSCEGTREMIDYCTAYAAKFGTLPLKYSAHAYDALHILADALEDETYVKESAMRAFTDKTYDNRAIGTLKLDSNGNIVSNEFEIRMAQDASFMKLQ